MPPDQPARLTALADDEADAAVPTNGTNGAPVEEKGRSIPDLAPAATEPVVSRRERRERESAERREAAPRVVPAAELTRKQRKAQYLMRARKVKRVIRRFDAWSVMKVSFVFYLCMYVVVMVAGILLWNVAARAGVVDNMEEFVVRMGAFDTFEFEPELILQGTALVGAVLVVVATGLTVLGATLFNLISDLVGGIRLTVIEEDGARPVGRPPRSTGSDKRAGRPTAGDRTTAP